MLLQKVNKQNPSAIRRHPLKRVYDGMLNRCYNSSCPHFNYYGGRGVKVCDRWLPRQPGAQGFHNFVDDMGERPEGTTLDRINSEGDYSPENCRWATSKEQTRNRSSNIMITRNGRKLCAQDWADEIGVTAPTIIKRYRRGDF